MQGGCGVLAFSSNLLSVCLSGSLLPTSHSIVALQFHTRMLVSMASPDPTSSLTIYLAFTNNRRQIVMATLNRRLLKEQWLKYKRSSSNINTYETSTEATKVDFTPYRERKLFELHCSLGPSWEDIAACLYEPASNCRPKFAPR